MYRTQSHCLSHYDGKAQWSSAMSKQEDWRDYQDDPSELIGSMWLSAMVLLTLWASTITIVIWVVIKVMKGAIHAD